MLHSSDWVYHECGRDNIFERQYAAVGVERSFRSQLTTVDQGENEEEHQAPNRSISTEAEEDDFCNGPDEPYGSDYKENISSKAGGKHVGSVDNR